MSDTTIIIVNETNEIANIQTNDIIDVTNIIVNEVEEISNIIVNETIETTNIIVEEIVEKTVIVVRDVDTRIIVEVSNITKYVAGSILSGQRLVMLDNSKVIYFDPTNENNAGKLVGITNQAALENELIEVVSFGVITNMSVLVPNSIYYARDNGNISTTPEPNGIFQRIGIAIDNNNLKIEFSEPLIIII